MFGGTFILFSGTFILFSITFILFSATFILFSATFIPLVVVVIRQWYFLVLGDFVVIGHRCHR